MKLAVSRCEIRQRAFTLSALLSLCSLIVLLVALVAPGLRRANLKAEQIRCAANLRHLGQAALMYAHADPFERFPNFSGGAWPWDMEAPGVTGLQNHGGRRDHFYCPAYPEMNNDINWRWSVSADGRYGFRVTGYAFAFQFSPRVRLTNTTATLNPAPFRDTGYLPKTSERVLIADATLSNGANETDRNQKAPPCHFSPHAPHPGNRQKRSSGAEDFFLAPESGSSCPRARCAFCCRTSVSLI